jgi:hypothetical protein
MEVTESEIVEAEPAAQTTSEQDILKSQGDSESAAAQQTQPEEESQAEQPASEAEERSQPAAPSVKQTQAKALPASFNNIVFVLGKLERNIMSLPFELIHGTETNRWPWIRSETWCLTMYHSNHVA